MITNKEAFVSVFAMGAVILFCRIFPFLFLKRTSSSRLGTFVEKTVPPVAMTVLAFNALGGAFKENLSGGLLVLAASVFTALIHLWKRNFLLSILGGTILYMILGLWI